MQILNVKSCVRILLACKNKDIISTVRLVTFLVVIILNLRIAADKTGQILRTKVVNEDDICQKMLKLQTPAKDRTTQEYLRYMFIAGMACVQCRQVGYMQILEYGR